MALKHACHVLIDKAVSLAFGRSQRLPTYYSGRIMWPARSVWQSAYIPYETYMGRAMKSLVRSGDVFWDIGAHVGWFSLFASSLVGSTGAVEAFEPSPTTFQKLSENLSGVGNTRAHNVGIGDKDEIRQFYRQHDDGSLGASSFVDWHPAHSAKVEPLDVLPITRLDTFYANHRPPNLMKIDIEGYEVNALRGGRMVLGAHKPDIIMEIHAGPIRATGAHEDEIFDILRDHQYKWIVINRNPNGIYTIQAT